MSYILTASGGRFYYDDVDRSDVRIEDIALALSRKCRFSGHTSEFYSVAQHCVQVSYLVPYGRNLEGLLHDASEAYMQDISTPLKAMLPDYRAIEKKVEARIMRAFDINEDDPAPIKRADLVALATERRDLMPHDTEPWIILKGVAPLKEKLKPWSMEDARRSFLARFYELTDKLELVK